MGVQLLDVITKLASYAMVVCFGLFAYYKITGKKTKVHYGWYALISLLIMVISGTAFFLTPQGQIILRTGNTTDSVLSAPAKKKVVSKDPKVAVNKVFHATNNLIFNHHVQTRITGNHLIIKVADSKDTKESLKLVTAEVLTTLKQTNLKGIHQISVKYTTLKGQQRIAYKISSNTLKNKLPAKITVGHLNSFLIKS